MKESLQKAKMLWIFLIMLMGAFEGYSQPITITGKVIDAIDKTPLPGVAVVVKGTTIGTQTDFNGIYSLSTTVGATLEFSLLGYSKEERLVGNEKVIDVSLIPDVELLSEVVVIGYGTQKKSDRTGSVAQVSSDELNRGTLTDPIQAMVGKAAGVSITKKGGDPNAGFSVKIRGSSGLYSNTEPLYVIDGVPGADPTTVAPEEIESFNILKDASSTAIYGARGANGVIIITTKKGSEAKKEGGFSASNVSYDTYLSWDVVAKRLDLMSASEYRDLLARYPDRYKDIIDNGANTDWQEEIFRTGFSQSHNFSGTGAYDKGSYRLSVNHTDWDGVILGSSKKRTIGKINVMHKAIKDRLTIDASLTTTFENNNYISYGGNGSLDVLYQAFQRNPTDPVYDSTGRFFEITRDFNYYNPVALIHQIQNQRQAKRYLGSARAELLIFEGLKGVVNIGYTRNDAEYFYFEPKAVLGGTTQGYGRRSYENFESRVMETTLNYDNKFAEFHNVTALLGYSYQEDIADGFFASGKNPLSDYMQSHNLGTLAL
ncbi:MAG TPA: SusC/RagA family TonB-linked outer membrane protein, partial [Salinivirgaceae bacterium]|nr:SusC/RagA family TonB-linked outer membrane protein [Salinivirgaceae bacterium]